MMKAQNMGPGWTAGAQLGSGQQLRRRGGSHLLGPLSSGGGCSGHFPAYLVQKTDRPCSFLPLKQIRASPEGKNQKMESKTLIDPSPRGIPTWSPGRCGVGVASQGPILSGLRTELAPGSPAFRQLPKYVDGSVDSHSCHVPRAHTKENMECFLDDIVSIQSHAFLWEGCEEGSRLAAGAGPLLRHAVLSADVGPRAMPTAKGVCRRVAEPWAGSCGPARAGNQRTPAASRSSLPVLCPAPGTQLVHLPAPRG